MKNVKKQNGITLIALLITIIVLIILATVAVNEMKEDGILGHANNTKQDFENLESNYNNLIGGLKNELTNNLDGDNGTPDVCISHIWSDWIITKEATACNDPGTRIKYCINRGCDAKRTETITIPHTPVNGGTPSVHTKCSVCNITLNSIHSFKNTVTDPKCLQEGYTTHSCNCGYTYIDTYTDPLKHFLVPNGKYSDYNSTKHTVHNNCKRCGATDVQDTLEAHSSVYVGTPDIHTKCDKCNRTLSSTHSYTTTTTKAATCTATGTNKHTCECGYSYTTTISKLGHDMNSGVVTKAATCTTDGVKTYSCKRTGCTYSYTSVIPKLGHNMNSGVETKAATCTTDGEIKYSCQRTGCTYSYTSVIPKLGHDMDSGKVTKAATCITDGVKTYSCQRTGCTYSYTSVIKGDHKWKFYDPEIVVLECEKVPRLDSEYCRVCGIVWSYYLNELEEGEYEYDLIVEELEKNGITIDMLGAGMILPHNWNDEGQVVIVPYDPDMCYGKERAEYTCLRCGKTKIDYTGNTLGHIGDAITWTDEEIYDCTNVGKGKLRGYCNICNSNIEKTVTNNSAHDWYWDGDYYRHATYQQHKLSYSCRVWYCSRGTESQNWIDCSDPDGDGYCVCGREMD